ncbi:PSRC1 protein, partial [Rhabdornis inornatus]|nr:PSRC1 protein [Rhabdornis inornatus]
GVVGDPPAPAGGPGAPRRWPRTEVRQRQRCVSPVGRVTQLMGSWIAWGVPATSWQWRCGPTSPSPLSPPRPICSQEEEEAEDSPDRGCRGGGNGRWSPLRGARLEEMVREATRLAAQLEGCHLPPPDPGEPPGPAATPPGTPRSPRRQTFVVKDSPVRALLPIVESRAPAPITHLPAKPQGASAATSVPRAPPSRNSTAVAKGPSGSRGLPPSRVGLPRPCPPQGQGAGARGRSEPPRGGTAGNDGKGTETPWPWGFLGHTP